MAIPARALRAPLARTLLDRMLLLHAAAWFLVALFGIGLVTAVIPNPLFGRGVPPTPFTMVTWLASAPLMGLVLATYTAPLAPAPAAPMPLPSAPMALPGASMAAPTTQELPASNGRDGSTLGAIGGVAAFLAIGCPTCNKIALLLLGASGAVTVFGPIQPLLGAASLALLAGSLGWRLQVRARGGACGSASRPLQGRL